MSQTIRSYSEAAAYLLAGRNHQDRPAPTGNATRIVRTGEDTIAVTYHRTAVVTFHADGRAFVFSGGWHTKTTAERIAEYLPRVWDVPGDHGARRPIVRVNGQDRAGRGDALHITGRADTWPREEARVQTCRRCRGTGDVSRGWAAGMMCDCAAGFRDYGSAPVPQVVAGGSDDSRSVLVIFPDGTTNRASVQACDVVTRYGCTCAMCAGGFSSWQEMYADRMWANAY
jgi:hypothetical protein